MIQAYQHVFKDSVIKNGKSFDVSISLEIGTHLPISECSFKLQCWIVATY